MNNTVIRYERIITETSSNNLLAVSNKRLLSNVADYKSSDKNTGTVHVEQVQVHHTRSLNKDQKRIEISTYEPKRRSIHDISINENDEIEDEILEETVRESYLSEWKLNLLYKNHLKDESFEQEKEKLQEELKNNERKLKAFGLQVASAGNDSKSLLQTRYKSSLNENMQTNEEYTEKLEKDVCEFYGVKGTEFELFRREKEVLKRVIWKVYDEKQRELSHTRAFNS